MQLEAKMKQILEDYAPLLNADVVEGESQEDAEERHLIKINFLNRNNYRSWNYNCTT